MCSISITVYLSPNSRPSPNSRRKMGTTNGLWYVCCTINSNKLWGSTPIATLIILPASSLVSSPPSQRIVWVSDNVPVLPTAVEVNNSMVDGAGEVGCEG